MTTPGYILIVIMAALATVAIALYLAQCRETDRLKRREPRRGKGGRFERKGKR